MKIPSPSSKKNASFHSMLDYYVLKRDNEQEKKQILYECEQQEEKKRKQTMRENLCLQH
jgi:hypothetical protein